MQETRCDSERVQGQGSLEHKRAADEYGNDEARTLPRADVRRPINPVKIYMRGYRDIVCQIRSLLRERDRHMREVGRYDDAFERATKATSRMRAVSISGTPKHDGMANAVMDMIRFSDAARSGGEAADAVASKLGEKVLHLCEALEVRLSLIDRLSDERYKTVMLMRYIEGADWARIIKACDNPESGVDRRARQVFYFHGKALEEIRLMPDCHSDRVQG